MKLALASGEYHTCSMCHCRITALLFLLCTAHALHAVAMVATSEKGYVSIRVTLTSPGGHSSQPPVDGSSLATRMAALLSAVDSDPPPAKLVSPTRGRWMHVYADVRSDLKF
jgi:hypothetical protein